jgi:hypothetical protein
MPETLTDAQSFAREALVAVTPDATVGPFTREVDEGDNIVSYRFETSMPGYPGWNWNVTVAHLPDAEPTIVETELIPAEGALLAPDWVPWSERMEDYRAAQAALGEASDGSESDDSDDTDDDDDESDDDDDEFDHDVHDVLHSGDLDGVDIDELDTPSDAVDENDDSEQETGAASVEPPRAPARRQRVRKAQQDNQGD